MNDKMREAMNDVFEELMAMPREEFLEELDKHSDGDITRILEYSGAIMFTHENLIDVDDDGEPTGKPIVSELETVGQVRSFIEAGKAGADAGERLKKRFGNESE